MKFKVIDFINENCNWKEILTEKPYSIKIKEDGEFLLLKYDQLESDFNLEIVRECRGLIITFSEGKYIPVRAAFLKFGNYGEGYAADIDWSTATVQEKIDGSLMSVWWYKGIWHLSTNGTIDAFKAPLGDFGMTFGDYFLECLNCSWEDFTETLSKLCCYTFEMIGPLNRVVVPYTEAKLYAIGQRNMYTMEECGYFGPLDNWCNIHLPKVYPLKSLDEAIEAATKMSKDEEGFVVCDAHFNRVKIKSPEYLMAARLHNNGVITTKRLIEIVLTEKVDDFIAYCPMYESRLLEIKNALTQIRREIVYELEWVEDNYCFLLLRAEYAKAIKDFKYKHFLFGTYDGKYKSVKEYLYSQRPEQILKLIETL